MRMAPDVAFTTETLTSSVSMSSALPIPVDALSVAVLPIRFAASPVNTSVIAPVVAVTLMALLVVVIWASATFVPASSVTVPLPVE